MRGRREGMKDAIWCSKHSDAPWISTHHRGAARYAIPWWQDSPVPRLLPAPVFDTGYSTEIP